MSARRVLTAAVLLLLALPAWAQKAPEAREPSQRAGLVMQPDSIADQPLRVTLVKPTAGQQFVVGSSMPLWANAEDLDDNIQSIWFQVDGTTVATTASGIASWVVTPGSHSVRACASNDHQPIFKTACTSTVAITTVPNQLPSATLTAPANAAIYTAGAAVTLTATASDNDGTIARVEFWVDGGRIWQDTSSPYSYSWNITAGNHTLQAKAVDDANGTGSSATVAVYGNAAPSVGLTSPAPGAVYTVGGTVPLAAAASDSDGIHHVEFWIDGNMVCQDNASPYTCNWTATAGGHSLQARALDNLGAIAGTVPITINGNPAPIVNLTSPTSGASALIGSYLSMAATASDSGGSVDHVEFLVDGAKVGQDYTSPYAYDWQVTAGAHSVAAKAIDNQGATTVSAAANIRGNQPPSIVLATPGTGAIYPVGALVGMTATADDADGTIARVEFWVDGAKVGQDTTSPYAYDWTATTGLPPGGNHAIQAKAVDDAGAIVASAAASIHIAPLLPEVVTRTYTYNSDQELCGVDEPETGTTLMGYDAAGNLAWSASGLASGTACDAEGDTAAILARKAVRTYDARNRIKTLQFPDLNGNQQWHYTPDGLPASVTTWNTEGASTVVNSYLYNKRRLPVAETQQIDSISASIGYGYDANGHLSTLTYPDGLSVGYAPNALGQPTQAGSYATGVSYSPNGAIAGFTYGNGIVHTLTQNARGLPERSRDADGSTPVHDDSYDYDPVGNVLAISDAVSGNRGDRDMAYDALNRLTSATSPMFGTASYAYDVLDNLTHVTVTGGPKARDQAYVYDEHNRLTNLMEGGASVVGLGYDVQGNLANRSGVAYTFDYGNRLRIAGPETYRYDVQGRRARANSGAGLVYSVYSQSGQLLFQRDQRAGDNRRYVYLGGSLVAESAVPLAGGSATVTYQHTDALGTPVAITNTAKTVIERREYEPYGYQTSPTLQDGPNYTGHVADAATGLVYMQQRYYDPLIGQHFLSVDPVTAYSPGGTFNRYWYASNNPYRFADPDGRSAVIAGPMLCAGPQAAGCVVALVAITAAAACTANEKCRGAVADAANAVSDGFKKLTNVVLNSSENSAEEATGDSSENSGDDAERNPKDDQRLSGGEIKRLDGAGYDVHEIKGGKNASKQDLFKDKQGNVYVKPKDGSGPGEPTGINLKDL